GGSQLGLGRAGGRTTGGAFTLVARGTGLGEGRRGGDGRSSPVASARGGSSPGSGSPVPVEGGAGACTTGAAAASTAGGRSGGADADGVASALASAGAEKRPAITTATIVKRTSRPAIAPRRGSLRSTGRLIVPV